MKRYQTSPPRTATLSGFQRGLTERPLRGLAPRTEKETESGAHKCAFFGGVRGHPPAHVRFTCPKKLIFSPYTERQRNGPKENRLKPARGPYGLARVVFRPILLFWGPRFSSFLTCPQRAGYERLLLLGVVKALPLRPFGVFVSQHPF